MALSKESSDGGSTPPASTSLRSKVVNSLMLLSYGWACHLSRHGEGCPAVAPRHLGILATAGAKADFPFAQEHENSSMLLSYGWASQPPAKAVTEFPSGIPIALLGIITAGGASNAVRLYPEKHFMSLAPLRGHNARSGSAPGCT